MSPHSSISAIRAVSVLTVLATAVPVFAGEYYDMNVTTIDSWAFSGSAAGFEREFEGPLTDNGFLATSGWSIQDTVGAGVYYDGYTESNPDILYDRFWVGARNLGASGSLGVGYIEVEFTLSQDCWLFEVDPDLLPGSPLRIDGELLVEGAVLTAGSHTLSVEINFDAVAEYTYYGTSFTYLTYPVPAPGALALLGCLGAARTRRRR